MEADTESLRKAAPNWSLAGDKQLLEMLQKIHQKIMTKCEEANGKLDAMVDALDNASIDLQNVNNKFMALSNSKFVESRVYDDDVDVAAGENVTKVEPLKVDTENEVTKVKRCLQRLEQMHEPVHILDSDSSDDEDDGRIILKPKQIYSDRPLPYIIGSQAWKNKWHVGLIQEDSDSDSSESKHDNVAIYNDEYSDSEPETAQTTDKLAQRTISSSSMDSELTSQPVATNPVTREPAKPADIAAELARRLGGPVQLPPREPALTETSPDPEPTTKKIYRVEKPAPTTVFSDEPPPLDDYQSYKSDYTDEDDIFAELHKKTEPNSNRGQTHVANDLFGGLSENIVDDLFGEVKTRDDDIGNVVDYQDVKPTAPGRVVSPIIKEKQTSSSLNYKSMSKQTPIETKAVTEVAVKKPVGGISLFGSNKGAESIGAAILRRNQRKSSTSDEDSSITENREQKSNDSKSISEPVNKIIEDLFQKPSKNVTKKKTNIPPEEPKEEKTVKNKIDLFSDNLFDDIDDIFTTNIVTKPKANSNPQTSIFDDDDLFADISVKKPEENKNTDTKIIFDSNDDLFSEHESNLKTEVKIPSNPINVSKVDIIAKENVVLDIENNKKSKQIVTKSIFDDDSGDDLFSDIKIVDNLKKPQTPIEKVEVVKTIENNHLSTNTNTDVNEILNAKSENQSLSKPAISISQLESPSLFDDDDFDDLFPVKTKSSLDRSNLNNQQHNIENIKDTQTIETTNTHSNKTIYTEGSVQINENIAGIKSEKITSASIDTVENTVMVDASNNSNIIDKKDESSISQSQENISHKNEILNHNPDIRILNSPNLTTKQTEILKQSESLSKDGNNIPSSDCIPKSFNIDSTEPSQLSEVFNDMPPAFEKPLEPKKSKNVNALFDDDSDDEALFFKKNEAISDEKPELHFSSERFRIFHDEPPEIDIDFTQKPLKDTPNILSNTEDELFDKSSSYLIENATNKSVKDSKQSQENVFQSEVGQKKHEVDITKLLEDSSETDKNEEVNVSKLLESIEENTKTESIDNVCTKPDGERLSCVNNDLVEVEEPESKKSIRKLKPMNININVNSLLPGATLKRSKVIEETDGQTISTKSNEELNIHSSEKLESKMVKSVSFDGDPESEVLDNKFSKQRAKIQVKRRPSSRRARLEAVRKSRIELASDSTDNSSSFDEPPYKEIVNREQLKDQKDTTIIQTLSSSSDFEVKTDTVCKSNTTELFHNDLRKETDNFTGLNNSQTDITSKLVYILNDEDIFNDTHIINSDSYESSEIQKSKLDTLKDDKEFLFQTPNISTLGKTYEKKTDSSTENPYLKNTTVSCSSVEKPTEIAKEISIPENKNSLFDDLSEDENELFGGNKKPIVQKNSLFLDSDSEGELFVKSKKENKPIIQPTRDVVKGSLFGDDSEDDDDLFGVKANNTGNASQNIQKPKETTKTAELVFEDPLSMFGDNS